MEYDDPPSFRPDESFGSARYESSFARRSELSLFEDLFYPGPFSSMSDLWGSGFALELSLKLGQPVPRPSPSPPLRASEALPQSGMINVSRNVFRCLFVQNGQ
jgi:hypothetical protein